MVTNGSDKLRHGLSDSCNYRGIRLFSSIMISMQHADLDLNSIINDMNLSSMNNHIRTIRKIDLIENTPLALSTH